MTRGLNLPLTEPAENTEKLASPPSFPPAPGPRPACLAIFGAGGHAKVVADIALQAGWGSVRFFADDYPQRSTIEHWPVEGDMHALIQQLPSIQGVIVAIGDCATRAQRQETLAQAGAKIATLIHPSATISQFAKIGPGTVIVAGAIINAFAHIGQGCIINTGATIGHDCKIGDYTHVAPGANIGGEVTVGERSWIGIGASVKQGLQIGNSVTIGAGAAVVNLIIDGQLAVGVPATAKM